MKSTLISLFILAFFAPYSRAYIDCPESCDASQCPRTDTCKGGLIYDRCGCCKMCAKLEWEPCGIDISGNEWLCDTSLACMPRNFPVSRCEQIACATKQCGLRQLCELSRQGRPVCVCPRNCKSGKWKQTPVCGKNGKQYTNACELYRHECQLGEEVGVMWPGPCKKCYFDGQTYRYGDSRKGSMPCEKCVCHHGEWRCRTKMHCRDQLRTCSIFQSSAGEESSTCPPGYWCKVQIPGIPDQGIPEVGVCVPAKDHAKPSLVTSRTNITSTENSTMSSTPGRNDANMASPSTEVIAMSTQAPTAPDWSVICKMPAAAGPCRAAMPQWYYNFKRHRCIRFIYGGCGGNPNNFDTKNECKSACMRKKGPRPTSSSATLTSANTMVHEPEASSRSPKTFTTKIPTPSKSLATSSSVPSLPPTWMRVFTFRPQEKQPYQCACSDCMSHDGSLGCQTFHGCYLELIEQEDKIAKKYGCIESKKQYAAICNTRSSAHARPRITVTCCRGEMCNDILNHALQKDKGIKIYATQATVVKETAWEGTSAPSCFDEHGQKFYGERAEWKPNDCTVCTCILGRPECVATVCRHPNCVDAVRIKGQCCPVCPIGGNETEEQKEMVKALSQSQLATVFVSIKKDQPVCQDVKSGELYVIGQSWKPDDCSTCFCKKNGKVECAHQMCGYPVCANPIKETGHCCPICRDEIVDEGRGEDGGDVVDDPHSCPDPVTGDYYHRFEMWQQDDCTACICGSDRKLQCTKKTCPKLLCDNPVHNKGRCCPICPADFEKGCVFEGRKYVSGSYKLLADECTLCRCGNYEWKCSSLRCNNPLAGE
ncbi:uncharacterized protein LOC5502690 isoform X2 [Nematostella vectensis]|uniref:uncharacterized protein LOC5502690 isoform X2 n=1 Tax=Nematostella vectensis TaxID=45351 RepID=UPI0020779BF9|nr:uncharacterized protein LOC5502690 isoform X2 [Nematostella vectensis]